MCVYSRLRDADGDKKKKKNPQPVEMLLLFTVQMHLVWVWRPLTARWEAISGPDESVWTEAPRLYALRGREGRGDAGDPGD